MGPPGQGLSLDATSALAAAEIAADQLPNLRVYVRLDGCSSVACSQLAAVGHAPSRRKAAARGSSISRSDQQSPGRPACGSLPSST